MSTSLQDAITAYELAVDTLESAIEKSVSAIEQQDRDALPAAIEQQQNRADTLRALQTEIKAINHSQGHASLRDAVLAAPDSASLQPRYRALQLRLKIIQKKLVSQAEVIARAIGNNRELIALLTNAEPPGAYSENGQTATTASNTLSARA